MAHSIITKTKVALMGFGFLGKWHAQKLATQNNVDFIAIVEPIEALHQKIKETYNSVKVVKNIKEVINEVDAIIVATPTSMHLEHTKLALENKKHVFCEKPLGHNVESALSLYEISKKNNDLIAQVGHSERCHEVLSSELNFIRNNFQQGYIRFERYGSFKGRATDVSCVEDIMVHDLDLMLFIFNPTINSCYAYGVKSKTQKWDTVTATFFADNFQFEFFVSRDATEEKRLFSLWGKSGSMQIDLLNNKMSKAFGDISNVAYNKKDHLLEEQVKFFESIQLKKPVFVNFRDGVRACSLVEHVLKSLDQNEKIEVKLPV